MGRKNADLIRAAERAKQTQGAASFEYLEAEARVTASQAACPHPHKAVRQMVASKTSKRVKSGDVVKWCVDCALPLALNGVPWAKVHPHKKPN